MSDEPLRSITPYGQELPTGQLEDRSLEDQSSFGGSIQFYDLPVPQDTTQGAAQVVRPVARAVATFVDPSTGPSTGPAPALDPSTGSSTGPAPALGTTLSQDFPVVPYPVGFDPSRLHLARIVTPDRKRVILPRKTAQDDSMENVVACENQRRAKFYFTYPAGSEKFHGLCHDVNKEGTFILKMVWMTLLSVMTFGRNHIVPSFFDQGSGDLSASIKPSHENKLSYSKKDCNTFITQKDDDFVVHKDKQTLLDLTKSTEPKWPNNYTNTRASKICHICAALNSLFVAMINGKRVRYNNSCCKHSGSGKYKLRFKDGSRYINICTHYIWMQVKKLHKENGVTEVDKNINIQEIIDSIMLDEQGRPKYNSDDIIIHDENSSMNPVERFTLSIPVLKRVVQGGVENVFYVMETIKHNIRRYRPYGNDAEAHKAFLDRTYKDGHEKGQGSFNFIEETDEAGQVKRRRVVLTDEQKAAKAAEKAAEKAAKAAEKAANATEKAAGKTSRRKSNKRSRDSDDDDVEYVPEKVDMSGASTSRMTRSEAQAVPQTVLQAVAQPVPRILYRALDMHPIMTPEQIVAKCQADAQRAASEASNNSKIAQDAFEVASDRQKMDNHQLNNLIKDCENMLSNPSVPEFVKDSVRQSLVILHRKLLEMEKEATAITQSKFASIQGEENLPATMESVFARRVEKISKGTEEEDELRRKEQAEFDAETEALQKAQAEAKQKAQEEAEQKETTAQAN
eukprot:749197-Hanusia_phi.AAC.3